MLVAMICCVLYLSSGVLKPVSLQKLLLHKKVLSAKFLPEIKLVRTSLKSLKFFYPTEDSSETASSDTSQTQSKFTTKFALPTRDVLFLAQ